jgi:hypothetical protein
MERRVILSRQRALDWLQAHRAQIGTGLRFNPFSTAAWLENFVTEVVDDRKMQAVMVEAEHAGQPVLATLSRDGTRPGWLRGLSNYYSSLDSPMHTAATDRTAAARALVRQLRREIPECGVLQLAPLDKESVDTEAWREALRAEGWYTKRYFCFGNWTLPCEGMTFAEYIASRDSRLYNTWLRKKKKFERGRAAAARLEIVERPGDVSHAIEAYEAVYAKSWKTEEPYPRFVRGWAKVCAERGWLRLGLAWVGELPVAAQFWFTIEGTAYIFKLAYDDNYSQWSAGTVLTAHLMRHALDVDHVREVDYLTGDDEYKKSWMTHRRERIGLLACRLSSPRGLAVATREVVARTARRFWPSR